MNPNELTPTDRVKSEVFHASRTCYKQEIGFHNITLSAVPADFALKQAAELERVKQDLKAMTEMRDTYADGFSTQSRLHGKFAREAELLEKERDELKRQVEELRRQLQLKSSSEVSVMLDLSERNELVQLRTENTELLKDRKRLERLMTLERGDLLWFHQEQDKRRALDILMEDEE